MGKNIDTFDPDLNPLLETASDEDLAPIVEMILQKGPPLETLSARPAFIEAYPKHATYADLIADSLRRLGGNSIDAIVKGEGTSYRKVVQAVAKRVEANYRDGAGIEEIEVQILIRLCGDAWQKMNEEERKTFLTTVGLDHRKYLSGAFPVMALQAAVGLAGGSAYRLALIAAQSVSLALLGKGLSLAAGHVLGRTLGVFAGPIGWALTGLWATYELAGPAFRGVVPCVVQVAMLRQRALAVACPECGHFNGGTARFCTECGAKLEEEKLLA